MNKQEFDVINQRIRENGKSLNLLQSKAGEIRKGMASWEAATMNAIASEIDENTNKPKYSNAEKREAEMVIRKTNSVEYANLENALEYAGREIAIVLNDIHADTRELDYVIATAGDSVVESAMVECREFAKIAARTEAALAVKRFLSAISDTVCLGAINDAAQDLMVDAVSLGESSFKGATDALIGSLESLVEQARGKRLDITVPDQSDPDKVFKVP